MRNFTQNIDNLEAKTGLDMKNKVVQAHGANRGAECAKCLRPADAEKLKMAIKKQEVIYCQLP